MAEYRLLTYAAAQGPRAGMAAAGRVYDVAALTGQAGYASVLGVLADWDAAQARLETAAMNIGRRDIEGMPLERTRLLAPVLYPSSIYCAGANYADHVREMAAARKREPDTDPHSLGLKPWHFIKASRSIAGPDDAVPLPAGCKKLDWEVELAAVIGRPARDVSVAKALDHVAGYTVADDLSARDLFARPPVEETSPFRYDWTAQKSFDGACPLGPWIVPAKEIGDPQRLGIKLWVNDVIKQDSDTGKMIFGVAEQIAHLSSRITLHPGDLVLTGTPAGVGAGRGEFLARGDVVRLWIERVGTLTHTIA